MSTSPAAAAADPGRSLSVLVVDDDFRVAGLHADVVAQTPGCAVAGTAHSAGAALALLERAESPVDLALVDLYLPDRPGLELLRALPCDTFVLSALLGDPREPRPAGAEPDRPTAPGRHLGTLREQGFAEARQGWCSASDALVAALR
ncbi:response regulator [Streptomyces sp. SID8499]|uniref:response regulator n=1 Tax=Streptomyces sp. SID8499 TaxID=2706106 RepID=UPI001944F371|nr:response regulator [Streptomyces sp. SID8499]